MAKKSKKSLPKERNFFAASLRDPSGPFRPKVVPGVKETPIPRKRKHKGKLGED
jgi:hypothetical protein